MIEKLTFKQYLDSKEQLRNAINNTPISIVEYEVNKYCSLQLGETEESKTTVALKPKHKVIVEWHYYDIDNPTPTNVRIEGTKDTDDSYDVFWSGAKLNKWLLRHARREN